VSFLLAVGLGRFLRFGVTALLVVRYGPEIVHVFGRTVHRHLTLTLLVFGVLVAFFTGLIARQMQAGRRRNSGD